MKSTILNWIVYDSLTTQCSSQEAYLWVILKILKRSLQNSKTILNMYYLVTTCILNYLLENKSSVSFYYFVVIRRFCSEHSVSPSSYSLYPNFRNFDIWPSESTLGRKCDDEHDDCSAKWRYCSYVRPTNFRVEKSK